MKMVAPCKSSKAEEMSGKGYLFLTVMLFSPRKFTHGRRALSFFSTKENPVPPGEDEGLIMPDRDLLMYLLMASRSGAEGEKRQPCDGEVPGNKSISQSYGLCGDREVALSLLNTSFKS